MIFYPKQPKAEMGKKCMGKNYPKVLTEKIKDAKKQQEGK